MVTVDVPVNEGLKVLEELAEAVCELEFVIAAVGVFV
jgi:hypothetical protein